MIYETNHYVICALISGAYSHDTLREDPPVSGVGDIANSVYNVMFLAPAEGYPAEEHWVTTEDGYIYS